jgi:hypothetical protein
MLLGGGQPLLRWKLVFERSGLHVTLAANEPVLYVEIRSGAAIVMSLGEPDDRLVFADAKIATVGTVDIYARSDDAYSPSDWLNDLDNRRQVESLAIQTSESVLVAGNRVSAILGRPLSVDIGLKRIDALIAFCASLPKPMPAQSAAPRSPLYARLQPWIREWGVPDDLERSELIDEALTETLLTFWETVGPLVDEIEDFLDSTPDDDEEALQMMWLAVAAAEIRLELQSRGIGTELAPPS